MRRTLVLAAAFAAACVTRWPFRTEHLFSWDSANYALAMTRIDIGAHQPHPPGYLGYVFAARVLSSVTSSANEALVLWNVIATGLSLFLLLCFTNDVLQNARHRTIGAIGAGIGALTSPLFWFYGETAEIYPSELLVTLAVAYAAHRASRGDARALPCCTVLLSVAALFKLTAALLIVPYVAYAWTRAPRASRRPAAVAGIAAAAATAALFLFYQPDLPALLWRQFSASTESSRLIGGHSSSSLRSLNRNARTTLMAVVGALGLVNAGMLVWWLATIRRRARDIVAMTSLWSVPWLALVLFVHIAKPGYVLPVLPPMLLATATVCASLPRAVGMCAIVAAALMNAAQFVLLAPPSDASVARTVPYRSKTLTQRAFSDLEPLAQTTRSSLRESDRSVAMLLARAPRGCPAGEPLIVAGNEPVDWRRLMWYLPDATAFYATEHEVLFVAHDRQVTPEPSQGQSYRTACSIIWLSSTSRRPAALPADAVPIPGLGYEIPAQTVRVTPAGIRFGSSPPGSGL